MELELKGFMYGLDSLSEEKNEKPMILIGLSPKAKWMVVFFAEM